MDSQVLKIARSHLSGRVLAREEHLIGVSGRGFRGAGPYPYLEDICF